MVLFSELLWAIVGYAVSLMGLEGYYPLIPAVFAICCIRKERNMLTYGAIIAGIGINIPVLISVKYMCLLPVIYVGVRLYGKMCHKYYGAVTAIIAGGSLAIINLAGLLVGRTGVTQLILGISEGFLCAGVTLGIYYGLEMLGHLSEIKEKAFIVPAKYVPDGRVKALSSAFEGLSETFKSMAVCKEKSEKDDISIMEQEVVDSVCIACDNWEQCWKSNSMTVLASIRKMLEAVVKRTDTPQIISNEYVTDCDNYEKMVKAAVEVFGRIELNYSWHRRLMENRVVIANQFDAMESLLNDWQDKERSLDTRSRIKKAKIVYEAKENNVEVLDVHFSENQCHILRIRMLVSSLEGTTSTKLLKAVEKAVNTRLRLKQDTPFIISRETMEIILYEDTEYYMLSGVASKKKNGSVISGDSYGIFMQEEGIYNLCLSDGMGTGIEASRESEMVIELFQNFLEAGFGSRAAVKMMNAAMVLKGEEGMFSTLDHAAVNLYTGRTEITKIGASSTFVKSGHQIECLKSESLPAGVDMEQNPESFNCVMSHGDFLVMMSDGVIEYLQVDKPEAVLMDIIRDVTTENAGAMARQILDRVLSYTGGYAMDDMTVLVAGIWEK